jgi:hypothetical protein
MREGIPRPLRGLVVLALFAASTAQVQTAPAAKEAQKLIAPTYRIFATREGLIGRMTANGHIIRRRDRFVALPSWSVLAPKGSTRFRVRVTYKGRSVVAPVWDVGPWNTKDDYWSPKRRYRDLPVGMPMAQAAHRVGYNGGRDEQGRRILLPNGIDLADGTFWDDLRMTCEDWVEVSFLWLGVDPGSGAVAVEDRDPGFSPPSSALEPGARWYEPLAGMDGPDFRSRQRRVDVPAAWPVCSGLLAYNPECGAASPPPFPASNFPDTCIDAAARRFFLWRRSDRWFRPSAQLGLT